MCTKQFVLIGSRVCRTTCNAVQYVCWHGGCSCTSDEQRRFAKASLQHVLVHLNCYGHLGQPKMVDTWVPYEHSFLGCLPTRTISSRMGQSASSVNQPASGTPQPCLLVCSCVYFSSNIDRQSDDSGDMRCNRAWLLRASFLVIWLFTHMLSFEILI